jgi:hypothetical protein
LQDSIGGNAKTVIVANISPSEACVQETLSTLGFAARARKIVNKVGPSTPYLSVHYQGHGVEEGEAILAHQATGTHVHAATGVGGPAGLLSLHIAPASPLVAALLPSCKPLSSSTLPHSFATLTPLFSHTQAVINEDHNDDVSLLRHKVRRMQQELSLARALAAKPSTGLRFSDSSAAADAADAAGAAVHRAGGTGPFTGAAAQGRSADEAAAQQLLEQQAELGAALQLLEQQAELGAALQLLGELGERNTELEQAADYWQR